MTGKNIKILVAGLVIILVGIWFFAFQNKNVAICEDLCGDGECQEIVCMAEGCPCAETKESCPEDCDIETELIGGQTDEHGCLIAAGYSWCEEKNKCLRTWEEPCELEIKNESTAPYDSFAKCLTEKGAKMYGGFWCGHCNDQKEMFGESVKYISYNECALSNGGQAQVCADMKIEAYPTWIFQDGERALGKLSFAQLSQKTGCSLP